MKIAYIITAYTDPQQLFRLINSLNYNSDFYIHVDAKVDIFPFIELLQDHRNVFFVKKRFFTNWGSFAQVLSIKELFKCILDSKMQYNRVVCISGTDYPIWSNERIFEEFSLHPSKQFIKAINLSTTLTKSQHTRINIYHFFRDIPLKNINMKKFFSGTSRLIMTLLPIRKKLVTEFESKSVDIYSGSDYWSLTFECAKYVYEKMNTEVKLMKYFKHSFVPSEMCIHTIVFNSEFASTAIHYSSNIYKKLEDLTPLHYIEYGKQIKIYTETDFNILLLSNKMFFRKALTGISDRLLNKIDLYRSNDMLIESYNDVI